MDHMRALAVRESLVCLKLSLRAAAVSRNRGSDVCRANCFVALAEAEYLKLLT